MKAAEWKRAVRPLVPLGERWEFRGSLCYLAPVGRFAFGVLGEGSGFDRGVYIWRVSMPLFVPSDVVDLSYSERLGGSMKYDSDDLDELARVVAIGVGGAPSERAELERLATLGVGGPNLRLLESAASSQALLGDSRGALRTIKQAARCSTRFDWEQAIIDRLALLAEILGSGVDAAVDFLDAQAVQSATALGLVHT